MTGGPAGGTFATSRPTTAGGPSPTGARPMPTLAARTAAPAPVYDRATNAQAVLADCLGRIITGRPLPEHLRPASTVRPRPLTVEAGIARILRGGAPTA